LIASYLNFPKLALFMRLRSQSCGSSSAAPEPFFLVGAGAVPGVGAVEISGAGAGAKPGAT
jgi:hypothetical protein